MFKVSTSGVYYEKDFNQLPEKITFRKGDLLHLKCGRYAISETIGQGGFGTVYLVRDDRGLRFAMKLLDLWRMKPNEFDMITARFEQGFKAGQIESDYLVRNVAQGTLMGNPYILMTYCPNGSLASRQQEFHDVARFEEMAIALLYALQDLHDNGIIHRDIKPDNLLFDEHDVPRLSDFDISGHLKKRLTMANWRGAVKEIWGTAVYAPPEQLNPRDAFAFTRPSMDMFAFGVTCYETLSGGHYPYGSFEEFEKNPVAFYEKVRKGVFTPLTHYRKDLPDKWIRIIHACLAADPRKRVQDASEVLALFGHRKPVFHRNVHVERDEWVLRVMMGEEVGREYNLSLLSRHSHRNVLRMGWSEEGLPVNDLSVKETFTSYISTRHATLEFEAGHWIIRDGQWDQGKGWKCSMNGTMVNHALIDHAKGHTLRHNDIVTVGETTLKVLHI